MEKDGYYIGTFDKLDTGWLVTWTNQRTLKKTEKLFPLDEGREANAYFTNRMFALANTSWTKIYVGNKAKTAQGRLEHEQNAKILARYLCEGAYDSLSRQYGLMPPETEESKQALKERLQRILNGECLMEPPSWMSHAE